MVPVKVVLAVEDRDYIEPLLNYVHGSEYARRLRITAFSQPEAFHQYMIETSGMKRPDVVVGEAAFLNLWTTRENADIPCLVLHEGEQVSEYGQLLLKYQPLSELVSSILETAKQRSNSRKSVNSQEGGMIIGMVAASGGLGRTTAALNMSKQLGNEGYSVFYLNLETMDSSALFTGSDGSSGAQEEGLSRLLYDLKSEEKEGASLSMASYCVHRPEIQADTFQPVYNRKELMDMTCDEAKELIRTIAESGQYDVVIVDGDSEHGERAQAVFEASHKLIWLLADDLMSMHKCGLWLDVLATTQPEGLKAMICKTSFVVNRYMGTMINSLPRDFIELNGVLPYIPSWKQMQHPEQLLSSPIYQREIRHLCRELLDMESAAQPTVAWS
ncbi:ParA family protein [Paenibacillus sp. CMAA1739]|uniref:ParA family protein n=1 Tax=Paenibacillus ottowii TaxID=2315729 RepID=UPI00272F65B1|nr:MULTISPECIES: ParA family protein [Paenibacillus]MDP1509664.1 ParA family protein [Paenibacillus ottowii]MEC4566872.1 ParA family protein [Paenibacillus sp. CMAA1739]